MNLSLKWLWQRYVDACHNKYQEQLAREYAESDDGKKMARLDEAARLGAEIEPPWIVWPRQPSWNQGDQEFYFKGLWIPFIKRLSKEERLAYLEKWQIPEEEACQDLDFCRIYRQ